MRAFLLDGLFTGALETTVLYYLPLFAFAYGASNGEIGLLVAAASLGAATSSLPGAWISEKWRHRKPFVLLTRSANVLLLALVVVPFMTGGSMILGMIIAAATMRSFGIYLGDGAWTSLAADLVPAKMRGRFFAARNLLIGVGGLAVAIVPLAWYFAREPWQVIPINVFGGMAWAGYMLASFNFLLAISPAGRERYYAAAYTTIMFLSLTIGPLVGGTIAAVYGIKVVLIASGLSRIAATGLFAVLVREEKYEPRQGAARRSAVLSAVMSGPARSSASIPSSSPSSSSTPPLVGTTLPSSSTFAGSGASLAARDIQPTSARTPTTAAWGSAAVATAELDTSPSSPAPPPFP